MNGEINPKTKGTMIEIDNHKSPLDMAMKTGVNSEFESSFNL